MEKLKNKNETSAGGIVFKIADGSILWLVTQHSLNKAWGFPKGLIGDMVADESRETAALREVREEGGVDASIADETPYEVHYTYRYKDYLVHKNVFYYLMRYEGGDPVDHDWEVSEAKFLEEKDVWGILTHPTDKEAFGEIVKKFTSLTKKDPSER